MGLAMAQAFAAEHMKVVLADIEAGPLDAAVADLQAGGHEAVGVVTDVRQRLQIEALAQSALDHFGAVHVAINNAGVVTAGRVAELTLEDWEWVIDIDLWGPIHGMRTFLPIVEAQGEGHLVSTASSAGLQAAANIGPYNVAKHGVVALMETVARELAARHSAVGASVLCPGAVNTRIVESERNRPPESLAQRAETREGDMFRNSAGALLARGLDPAVVADMVVDAIRTKRFWIITHPGWYDVLAERVARMRGDGGLVDRFGG